jgi:phospholipid/cholesterol/gamma-HCH transport system substrate-binding protein
MKFRVRFAEQVVGVFILLAILAVAAAMVLLGLNQRWFARNYSFWSRFASAEGLSVGMPLKLKGFEIGKVDKITLGRDNLVDMEFHIYDTYYPKVQQGSVLELVSSPLGLGGGLEFHPGADAGPPLPESSFIPSSDLEEGRKLLARDEAGAPAGKDPIATLLAQVEPVLKEIDATVGAIHAVVDTLNRDLQGKGAGPLATTLNEVAETTKRINAIAAEVEKISVSLGRVSVNLEATSAAMRDPTGLAKRLLDPKGSVATLLDDDNALYNQLMKSLQELDAVITQLAEFTRFVNSTQPQILSLLEQGRSTLDQGQDVLEAVKNNPLLRGGIPAKRPQQTTFKSYRDEDF